MLEGVTAERRTSGYFTPGFTLTEAVPLRPRKDLVNRCLDDLLNKRF